MEFRKANVPNENILLKEFESILIDVYTREDKSERTVEYYELNFKQL